jgi:hypothetical protein
MQLQSLWIPVLFFDFLHLRKDIVAWIEFEKELKVKV